MNLKKIALITGASSGIGKELANIHASKGGDIIAVARDLEALEKLKIELEEKYKITVTVIKKDLGKIESAKELFDEVKQKGIEVDYLFNNAGFGLRGEFSKLSWQRQQEMINLNIIALTELTHLFLSEFIKKDSGKILNTSSTAALVPGPLQAVYYATKAYVSSFSNALAEELRDTNITVTALMPGATDTKFAKTANMTKTKGFAQMVTPQSVANDGYEAMIRGDLDVISGLTTMQKIMITLAPLFPKKILLKQVREFQEVK